MSEVPIAEIHVGPRRRMLNEQAVVELMGSIERLGFRGAITVTQPSEGPLRLVCGRHSLEAMRRLARTHIPAFVLFHEPDDDEVALLEIASNLFIAELTPAERDQHVRDWHRIASAGVPPGGTLSGQPHDVGISRASRELGIPRATVAEAIKLGNLDDEAVKAADEHKLSRKDRLKVAEEPQHRQIDVVHSLARNKDESRQRRRDEDLAERLGIAVDAAHLIDDETLKREGGAAEFARALDCENDELERIVDAWNSAGRAAQARFAEEITLSGNGYFPRHIERLSVL